MSQEERAADFAYLLQCIAGFNETPKTYDIGEANKRQSDFFQGYEDAHDRKPMKENPSHDYWRGYRAGWRPSPYSDASHGE